MTYEMSNENCKGFFIKVDYIANSCMAWFKSTFMSVSYLVRGYVLALIVSLWILIDLIIVIPAHLKSFLAIVPKQYVRNDTTRTYIM